MRIFLVIICSCALLVIGCSFGGPTASQGDVVFPLSVDSEWQGTITFYNYEGNITDQSPMTFKIIRDTVINDKTWYFVISYTDDVPIAGYPIWLLSNSGDGLHQIFLPAFSNEPNPDAEESLWLKYPAKTGDSYVTNNSESIVVKSTNVPVVVPQGSYHCIEYDYIRPFGYTRHYAAPGIGLVRIEVQLPYEYTPDDPSVVSGWTWKLEKLIIK